jgi:isoquinoline 1-oxidoreductase beta subunit
VHRCFVTYVAMVIEAAVDAKGNILVPRVDAAVDCGFHVNPERIRSQIEGATVMGLSLAMKGEISFKGGRVEQSNFNDYEVLRIDEAPRETRVHIIPADISVPPSGVGEPGVPPVDRHLQRHLAATGKRIRRLPIRQQVQSMQG